MTVYGFGKPTAPEGFRQACNRFIDIDTLERSDAIAPAVATDPPPADEIGHVDAEVVRLLIEAYKAAKRDHEGFADLGEVGQRASNRSNFDTRNYGFPRLSDMMEAIPDFTVSRREDGVFVKRVK